MKTFFLSCLLCCAALISNAQLTRSETIKYIQDKINDAEFLKRTYDEKFTYNFTELKFKQDPTYIDKIQFSRKRNFSDNTADTQESTFLPQYITSIEKSTEKAGDAVGLMIVNFTAANVADYFKSTTSNITYSSKRAIHIPYLQGDPLHYERLMKAFLHLKEVSIEALGEDPFVN